MVPKEFSLPSQIASFGVEVAAGQPRAVWELHQWHVADAAGIIEVHSNSTSLLQHHLQRTCQKIYSGYLICHDLRPWKFLFAWSTLCIRTRRPVHSISLIRCNDGSTNVEIEEMKSNNSL